MPGDNDQMIPGLTTEFGSGVIGICDVCGTRQAVIVLQKERFKLCVLDFLNKTWNQPGLKAGAPLPPYRSERVWFPTDALPGGKAPAVVLSPTKPVKRPVALVTPDVYGLTTSVLDLGIRLAREGCEVLLPDIVRVGTVGPRDHLTLRIGTRFRGGVPLEHRRIQWLRRMYRDGLRYLRSREMVDPERVVLAGVSYGAALAAALAAEERSVSAVILAYPPPVRPAEFLKLITAPVLFIDAGRDPLSRAARTEFESLQRSGELTLRLSEQPAARHHFLARDLPAYDLTMAEAAWTDLSTFLRPILSPAPPKPPTPPAAARPPAPAPPTAPTKPTPGAPATA